MTKNSLSKKKYIFPILERHRTAKLRCIVNSASLSPRGAFSNVSNRFSPFFTVDAASRTSESQKRGKGAALPSHVQSQALCPPPPPPPGVPSTKNIVWPLLDVMPASCTDARERFPPPASHPCLSSLQISTVSVKGSLQKEPAASVLFFFSTSLERPDTKLEPMKRSPPKQKPAARHAHWVTGVWSRRQLNATASVF